MESPRLVSEREVREHFASQRAVAALVAAIEHAFGADFAEYRMPPRTFIDLAGRGTTLLMPCYHASRNRFGLKIATVGPTGVEATYQLLDPMTGQPLVVMQASHLTAIRTAAASAVATKYMACENARTLGIFGTGRLARTHLQVLRAVRPFARFLVCGRNPASSAKFAADTSAELGLNVEPASPRELVGQSDVICTCTNHKQPLFEGAWLHRGTHLNLTGIYKPTQQEVDCATVVRSRVIVDLREGYEAEAGDLMMPMHQGLIDPQHVLGELHDVVTRRINPRRSPHDITLFKSVGVALEDMVAAELVLA